MNRSEEQSLRECAHHEAGHAVISEALTNSKSTITIERRSRADAVWFAGRCTHVRSDAPSVEAQQMSSLAGPIAESIVAIPSATFDQALRDIGRRMSVTDQQATGYLTQSDVRKAIQLVKQHWPAITARAEAEIARFHAGTSGATNFTPVARPPARPVSAIVARPAPAGAVVDDDDNDFDDGSIDIVTCPIWSYGVWTPGKVERLHANGRRELLEVFGEAR
jgi:hypothetical protein